MLTTRLCEVLGLDHPVIQAAMAPVVGAELAAAVSNAGGLGSLGTALVPPERVREELERLRELTDRPFAVNHTYDSLDPEAVEASLQAHPAVISFALGDPGDLIGRAHDVGARFMQQVSTVAQAERAAEAGADVIVAQGGEAGGFVATSWVSTMALVPQVVDAVAPLPVVAAGGIADGRGLAAALVLGASGVNIGTRFLACTEARVDEGWKRAITAAASQDAVHFEGWREIFPPRRQGGFDVAPRSLRTPFVDRWRRPEEDVPAVRLREEITTALRQGRVHEVTPLTGQSAGLIHDVLPAAEIVHRLVAGAEEALAAAGRAVGS